MNTGLLSNLLNQSASAGALGAMLLLVAGCSTAGYHKSDATAATMQTAAAEVQAEGRALDATLVALRTLLDEPSGDLQQKYKTFTRCLAQLEAAANRVEATGNRMHERSEAYFRAWDKQLATIDFEHIRDLSEGRRTEVANRFDAVHKRYLDTAAVMAPLIGYLQDIRKALSSDLTPEGLAAMRPVVRNADVNTSKVQIALSALTSELTNSSGKMSSFALQNAQ